MLNTDKNDLYWNFICLTLFVKIIDKQMKIKIRIGMAYLTTDKMLSKLVFYLFYNIVTICCDQN